jgi:hypothetical protein
LPSHLTALGPTENDAASRATLASPRSVIAQRLPLGPVSATLMLQLSSGFPRPLAL